MKVTQDKETGECLVSGEYQLPEFNVSVEDYVESLKDVVANCEMQIEYYTKMIGKIEHVAEQMVAGRRLTQVMGNTPTHTKYCITDGNGEQFFWHSKEDALSYMAKHNIESELEEIEYWTSEEVEKAGYWK